MDLKAKIKELPACPGVYLMKDSLDNIIYVGKSKNLKSRVGSYFIDSKSHSPKVIKLVKSLKDFDYIITDTEFEAFMLECRLIKEIKPFYNKLMKSPRAYSYIKLNTDKSNPAIEMSDEADKNDGCLYFGPYTNRNTVERGLQGIKESCKILCTGSTRKTGRCLNYSLGLCVGICSGDASMEQYLSILEKIEALLKGTDKSIIEAIEHSMSTYSEKLDFENAAKYRDYLRAVKYLAGKAKVVEYTKANKNILILEPIDNACIKYFLIKGSKVLFSERLTFGDNADQSVKPVLKSNIIHFFSINADNSSTEVGKEEIDEAQIIYSYLNSHTSSCKHLIINKKWMLAQNISKLDKALDKLLQQVSV